MRSNGQTPQEEYEILFMILAIIGIPLIAMVVFYLNGWEILGDFMFKIVSFSIMYTMLYVISSFTYETTGPRLIHTLLWLLGCFLMIYISKWIGAGTGFIIAVFIIPYLLWTQLRKMGDIKR